MGAEQCCVVGWWGCWWVRLVVEEVEDGEGGAVKQLIVTERVEGARGVGTVR